MITLDLIERFWRKTEERSSHTFGAEPTPLESSVAFAVANEVHRYTRLLDRSGDLIDAEPHVQVGFLCGVLYGLQLGWRDICEDPAFSELSQLVPELDALARESEGSSVTVASYVREDDGSWRLLESRRE